ncbi:MAG TPA: serine hydrolase [Pyrinomonadaceae bacterium]|jgi:CubicO group peptidase (beta-lactamase class C family)
MMRLFLFLTFVFSFQFFAVAQSRTDKAEALLRREMRERRIPGLQAAVVQRGKITLLESFGVADIQNSVPVTGKSVFAINSCTKAFTGVAIMQLVEEGKIELSAPVSRYLEGLPGAWQAVTVRQLLTHISGLPNLLQVLDPVTNGLGNGLNEETVWTKTKSMPMAFPVGERFSYNQTNYALLGKIIDKLSGKPFAQAFRERQFQIAGMPSTGFGDSRDVVPNMAPAYRYVKNLDGQKFGEDKLTNNYAEFPPFRRTASGMNSTAEDIARWIIALQQGKLLKTKTALNELWTAGTYNNGSPAQWALGWMTKSRLRHSAVIATGGGRAAFFVYPEDDLAVVVLTNLAGAFPEEFIDELAGFYNPEISASDPVTALRIELRKRGYENALEVFDELKRKDSSFQPSEKDLNDWAYRMLNGGGKPKDALEIFKLNVFLYPASANVYDSVAEAYAANGERELAVRNYKRSLELDPQNTNAVRQLKKLDPDYGNR